MTLASLPDTNAGTVLCKALFNVKDQLKLTQSELGQIIGLERTSIARLKDRGLIEPTSKTAELASLLIRVFRSLYALMGGEADNIRHWLNTHNHHLNGTPRELLLGAQGLVEVNNYLDAIRGKN